MSCCPWSRLWRRTESCLGLNLLCKQKLVCKLNLVCELNLGRDLGARPPQDLNAVAAAHQAHAQAAEQLLGQVQGQEGHNRREVQAA